MRRSMFRILRKVLAKRPRPGSELAKAELRLGFHLSRPPFPRRLNVSVPVRWRRSQAYLKRYTLAERSAVFARRVGHESRSGYASSRRIPRSSSAIFMTSAGCSARLDVVCMICSRQLKPSATTIVSALHHVPSAKATVRHTPTTYRNGRIESRKHPPCRSNRCLADRAPSASARKRGSRPADKH